MARQRPPFYVAICILPSELNQDTNANVPQGLEKMHKKAEFAFESVLLCLEHKSFVNVTTSEKRSVRHAAK